MILFLLDPGGKKGEIRNRAMSGLGACWAVGGQENRVVSVGAGGRGNCDIHTHTHAHNGWLMGKQAGQGGGRGECGGLCS